MKRVLIFSVGYYPKLVGGAEVAIKEITDRVGEGFEFDMVTMYAGNSRFEKIGNVNIYRVGPHIHIPGTSVPKIPYIYKFGYVAAASFTSLWLHYKRRYDFTWSIMASFNAFANLFFSWFNPRVPFVLNLQEGDTPEHIKKSASIMYPFYMMIFRRATFIHCLSNYLVTYAKDMGARCPIVVVPNGVNYKFFSEPSQGSQIKALYHELGIKDEDTVLVTTSRLVQKNGVADIIDSLTYLPETTKLIILGTGPLEEMLKEKTALLKLNDRVKFVGYVPHRELPIYLHASHIFVRPSLSEGFGVSFMEAMAAGLPVVTTNVGGIPDFLTDHVTGLFAEVGNGKSVAEKVELYMKDEALKNSIVKKARELVKEKYDWDLISEEMRKIFLNIK
jgi:glycosyltransferase involved in cell wall biosynthesis